MTLMDKNNQPADVTSFPTISIPPSPDESGKQMGFYRLIRKLGEGGWGIVYLAEQDQPIKRQVALKLIKRGMESKQVLARFEAERQALAVLDSPYIAHVYDAGMTEDDRPYFAMEYIEGVKVTDYCDQHQLSIKQRLELFVKVCEGIQHAHQKGIIHRDIKPSNILVSIQDERGIPKIIDFGVAKALYQPLTEKTIYTEEGQLIGTPEYMSPEQAQISQENVDIRTDVYSLGVLLYELLTGALPFDRKTLRLAAFYEVLRIIREQDPPRPSAKLTTLGPEAVTIAQNRKLAIHALKHTLNKELEWIPLKAIRKEPSHRYQTALEFMNDIQNYLTGEPLSAGPESLRYRTHKFIQRNKVIVSSAVAVFTILIIGIILSSIFAIGQFKAKEEAQNARLQAVREATTAAEEAFKAQQTAYFNSIALVDSAIKNNAIHNSKSVLADCPENHRNWEWYYLWNQSDMSSDTIRGHFDEVTSVLLTNDTNLIISGSLDGTIRQWDINTGKEIKVFDHKGPVTSVAISPDEKVIASGALGRNRTKIWDAITGENIRVLMASVDFGSTTLCFTSNGDLLVADDGYSYPIVYWYDSSNWSEYHTFRTGHGANLTSMSIHWKKQIISTGSNDGSVKIFDLVTKKPLSSFQDNVGEVYCVVFSHNGKYLAYSGKIIRLIDIETKKLIHSFKSHKDKINSMAFSPDDTLLVSGGADNTIKLWDIDAGEEILTLHGHRDAVQTLAFSSDGKQIVSGSKDKTIKIWDMNKCHSQSKDTLLDGKPVMLCLSISPNGKNMVAGSENGNIMLFDIGKGTIKHRISKDPISAVTYSADGKRIIAGSSRGVLTVCDSGTGSAIRSFQVSNDAITSLYADRDNMVLGGTHNGDIKTWDMTTGEEILNIKVCNGPVTSLSASDDGKTIIMGGDGLIKIWDAKSKYLIKTMGKEDGNSIIFCAELFNIDSIWGAIIDADNMDPNSNYAFWHSNRGMYVWDLSQDEQLFMHGGQDDTTIRDVSFSKSSQSYASLDFESQIEYTNMSEFEFGAIIYQRIGKSSINWEHDNQTLLTTTMENSLKLINIDTRKETIITSGKGIIKDASITTDGSVIAYTTDDVINNTHVSLITVWDLKSNQKMSTFGDYRDVDLIEISPLGNLIASAGDNNVRLWDPKTGTEINRCVGHTKLVSSISFSPDGRYLVSGSMDKTVKLWDVKTGTAIKTLSGHNGTVNAVSFSNDGKYISSGSDDKAIIIWEVDSGNKLHVYHGHNGAVMSVSFSPDGKRIISGSSDKTMKLWSLEKRTEVLTIEDPDKEEITTVSFSPNGKYIAYGNIIGAVRLLNSSTQESIDKELSENSKVLNLTEK